MARDHRVEQNGERLDYTCCSLRRKLALGWCQKLLIGSSCRLPCTITPGTASRSAVGMI